MLVCGLVVSLVTSCSDGPHAPAQVTIETGAPPALLMFRDEAGPSWQTLASDGIHTFELTVTGLYRVVVVCTRPDSFDMLGSVEVREFARTPDDALSIVEDCRYTSRPFTARGVLTAPGTVTLEDRSADVLAPNGDFAILAGSGSFDLVVVTTDHRIAVRRGVAITGETDLGIIDVAQQASALVPIAFTCQNCDPGESLQGQIKLFTRSTIALLSESFRGPWPGLLAPEVVLRSDDRQQVFLAAASSTSGGSVTHQRSAVHDFHAGDRTAIELPAVLGPVSFDMTADRLAATWSSLPAYDAIALSRSSFSDRGAVSHGINLSRAYVEATAAASATLDLTDIPGFPDAWRIKPTDSQSRALNAYRNSGLHDQVYSLVFETLPLPSGIDHASSADPGAPGNIAVR
jgi:hypothetical protein